MSDKKYKIDKVELRIGDLPLAESLITGLTLHEAGPKKLDIEDDTMPIPVEIPSNIIGVILEKYADIRSFDDVKDEDFEKACSAKLVGAIKYIFRVGLLKFPEHLKDLQRMQNDAENSTKH